MRYFSSALSLITAIYTLWYMHFEEPWTNDGALSTIGLEHRAAFVIWGILTFVSLALATTLVYRKLLKTWVYIPLLALSGIAMALTLIFDFDSGKKPDFYLHCGGSLVFSAVTGFAVFLAFLLCYKRGVIFKVFTYLTAAILIGDIVFLIIFKETGLIEAVPIFAGYIMLGITNLRGERIEAARST
jgi:hypothetical protein